MRKPIYIILLFVVVFFGIRFLNHTDAKNYTDAHVISRNDTVFIELKGRRSLMNHEVWSCNNKTYEATHLIPIPKLADGKIEAKDLLIGSGGYKRTGYILINKSKLTVSLFYDNTDDKKIDPSDWNGEYNLIR
jgi:hypothetical protein